MLLMDIPAFSLKNFNIGAGNPSVRKIQLRGQISMSGVVALLIAYFYQHQKRMKYKKIFETILLLISSSLVTKLIKLYYFHTDTDTDCHIL